MRGVLAYFGLIVPAVATLTSVVPASGAEFESSDTRARGYYAEGVRLSGSGQVDLALDAFESAYAIKPHYAVLFNIGQLRLALGQPVEAMQALEEYLRRGADQLDSQRSLEAQRALEICRRRMGTLAFETVPPDAKVVVDGVERPDAAGGIRVAIGAHSVVLSKPGYEPVVLTPVVRTQTVERVAVRLTPRHPNPAWVEVHCDVPEIELSVDDGVSTRLPPQPLTLSPGEHEFTLRRRGYRPDVQRFRLEAGELRHVNCSMQASAPVSARDSGTLRVHAVPADAATSLDGAQLRSNVVPVGSHDVKVVRAGYLPWRRTVRVESEGETLVNAILEPTQETRSARDRESQRRRTIAYTTGAAGLVVGGAAAVAMVVNSRRYDEWAEDRETMRRNEPLPEDRDFGDLAEEAANIQRIDDLALGGIAVGAVLLGIATYLFVTDNDTDADLQGRSTMTPGRYRATLTW